MSTTIWTIDPTHFDAEFAVKHLMISTVKGRFADVKGTAQLSDSGQPKIDVTIGTASIDTRQEQRDNHLRSADFFDVEKFPAMRFVSTRAERDGNEWKVTGDLTIKDVTKPVTLEVLRYGEMNDDQMGHRIGYAAQTEINRKDFGMRFDAMRDGRFIVSNEVQISIEGEVVEVKDQAAAANA